MKRVIFYAMFFIFITSLINAQWVSKKKSQLPDWGLGWSVDALPGSAFIFSSSNSIHSLFISENNGNDWTKIPLPTTSPAIDISFGTNGSTFWIATDSGKIYRTINKGATWEIQFDDTTKTKFMNYIEMFDDNNGIAMGDAIDGSEIPIFLRTYDGGNSWISINNTATGGVSADIWHRLDFINTTVGYFSDARNNSIKLFKTNDGGNNWYGTNFTGDAWLVKFYNKDLGLIFTMDYDSSTSPPTIANFFKRTTDGGNTWEKFKVNMSHLGSDIEFLPGKPSNVWYTNKNGLFYSKDTGRTWQEYDLGVEGDLQGRDLVFTDQNHGWLLCDNGKIYYTENNGGITVGVNEENLSDNIPAEFNLYQNYPNPFNPATNISYSLKSPGFVKLSVYDISGQLIKVLVNEQEGSGYHTVPFDGSKLSSGIYIYRLETDQYASIKKMQLIK